MNKNDYIKKRLSNNVDDRNDEKKLDMDAKLRGSIGEKEANRIIKIIDNEKQRG